MPAPAQAPPAEPVVVARLTKNRRECVKVCLTEYMGTQLVDVRVYAVTPDGDRPTKQGANLNVRRIRELREALQDAEAAAERLGLIPARDDAQA